MMDTNDIIGLEKSGATRPRPAPTGFEGTRFDDAVRDLITTYHSLNSPHITELSEEPSPLEFMRYVSQNRPFVIRKGAESWAARKNWNVNYLKDIMGDQLVNVSMTPHGNADSVLEIDDGGGDDGQKKMIFVKPYEIEEPFSAVVNKIQKQELQRSGEHKSKIKGTNAPTRYAQTQNDNLRHEYSSLFGDIPPSIPFARIALQKPPDAINFWLGNSYSTTALHKDNYENIYVQILGRKHFVLLPPVEAACVNERSVLSATYEPRCRDGKGEGEIDADPELLPRIDTPHTYTPFATWDPDARSHNATPYSSLSQPMKVTLEEGDMLYLPALWYHKVSQSCNEEGVCCAVNYWYDLNFGGGFWSMAGFVRGMGLLSLREGETDREEVE